MEKKKELVKKIEYLRITGSSRRPVNVSTPLLIL